MKQVVVVFSGGMDSATLLYFYLKSAWGVAAVSFDYGQRHRKELEAAGRICHMLNVEHRVVDLSSVKPLLAGSSQTDDIEVPEGHYADENMKKTVVPNRNMVMLAVAGAWAISRKADVLAYGAHAGDHTIYPDCRPSFVVPLSHAFQNADWHKLYLDAPFLGFSKGQIAHLGYHLGVPFNITWTCYKGLDLHCGKCGACTERREAFAEAGIPDPTEYVPA